MNMLLFFYPQVKEVKDFHEQENKLRSAEAEVQKLRGTTEVAEKRSNRITELEDELRRLRIELEREREEKQDVISEKELMRQKYEQVSIVQYALLSQTYISMRQSFFCFQRCWKILSCPWLRQLTCDLKSDFRILISEVTSLKHYHEKSE